MEASPLNKLPAELRNRIYEYALTMEHGIWLRVLCHGPHKKAELSVGSNMSAAIKHCLALTATCTQIRQEAHPLFFWCNAMVLNTEMCCEFDESFSEVQKHEALNRLKDLLQSLGGSARHINHLTVRFNKWVTYRDDDDYLIEWLPQCIQDFHNVLAGAKTQFSMEFSIESFEASYDTAQRVNNPWVCLSTSPHSASRWRADVEEALRMEGKELEQCRTLLDHSDAVNAERGFQQSRIALEEFLDNLEAKDFQKSGVVPTAG